MAIRIALLGTGKMGYPMAEKLRDAGYQLRAYNRTIDKAKTLESKGVSVSDSANDAMKDCDLIILMLKDAAAIRNVLFAEPLDTFEGKTFLQMGTIAPSESIDLQKKIFEKKGEYLEAPVLGSRPEVKNGTLIVMVGATEERFIKWRPLLKTFGKNPVLIGGVGKAAALKLAFNHMIAGYAFTYALSLGIIEKNNIDIKLVTALLKESSLYSKMFEKKLPRWQKRDYADANFTIDNLSKDVDLILNEAKDKTLGTSVLEVFHRLLTEQSGLKGLDYSALYELINPHEK